MSRGQGPRIIAAAVAGPRATPRHEQGSRAARVRASRGNGLWARVRQVGERRIDGIRARTPEGGGTDDRVADRREEAGTLRRESRS